MTPEEFVKGFYLEQKTLVDMYFNPNGQTDVSKLIQSLNLNSERTETLRQILMAALRDALYTTLLGLDGEAQIGGRQETYIIKDQNGNELTGGEIEGFAWEYFHNNKLETDGEKSSK